MTRVILGDELLLDIAAAERDLIEADQKLLAIQPDDGAVLLECTNMCPMPRLWGSAWACRSST